MQPLANVLIKHSKVGSTIPKSNVTPAELFVLIAQFRDLAGGNPVVGEIDIIPENREELQIAPLQMRLASLKEKYASEQVDQTITEETRNQRLQSTSAAIIRVEDNIKEWQHLKALRTLDASTEKMRLLHRYPNKLVEHLFPGRFPSVPPDFNSAKEAGLGDHLMDGFTPPKESFFHTAHIA